jgi:WD40 repeat protein
MSTLSSLFISHSSCDRALAKEIGQRLKAEGYKDVFLDFDPVQGIPAGRKWEREIYAQLRKVDGVLFLASPASVVSKWCFAELTLARLLSKPIFPLRLDGSAWLTLLDDVQWIDLTEREEAFTRLWTGLRLAGFDPQDSFAWDPTRSPYPGLQAFAPEDAAVFFGRQEKIDQLMERLDPLTRGASRMVTIVGPSGSGKSSLLRAGLLPRLARLEDRWLLLPPMLPGSKPIANLAHSLARAFAARGEWHPGIRELEQQLASPSGLVELVGRLLDTRPGYPNLLVVIDQAEELIIRTGEHEQQDFLRLIHSTLSEESRMWVVATLRSEFLSRAPERAGLTEEAHAVVVEPLSRARLPEVILRPAQRAGIEFEPVLVERMAEDTVGGDALPLLAYTLQELYKQRARSEATISLRDYEAIGGVTGALRRHADRVMAELQRQGYGQLVLSTLLKLAAVDQRGEVTRRRLPRSALNADEQTVVQDFINAWLLISNKDSDNESTVEVAHEALLRQWPPLLEKINEFRHSLQLRSELDRLASDWDQRGRGKEDEESYLLRGGRLDDFLEWSENHPAELDSIKQAFLRASQEFQKQRIQELQDAANLAFTRQLLARAVSLRESRPDVSLLLDATALDIAPAQAKEEARFALLSNLARPHHVAIQLTGHTGAVRGVAFSPDETTLATGSWDKTMRLWDPATGQFLRELTGHTAYVYGVAFSRDGKLLASASVDQTVRLWDPATGQLLRKLTGHTSEVAAVAFSPGKKVIATASKDKTVRLWDPATGQLLRELTGHTDEVVAVAFSRDGKLLASGSTDQSVRLWDPATGQLVRKLTGHTSEVAAVAFSPDKKVIATASKDKTVRLWQVATGQLLGQPLVGHSEPVHTVAFSPDGKLLASASRDRTVRLWDPATGQLLHKLAGHTGWVNAVAFSRDGKTLASASGDNTVRLWELAEKRAGSQPLTGHIGEVYALALDPDGKLLASASRDRTVRLWDPANGQLLRKLTGHTSEVAAVAFSPDKKVVATASKDKSVRLWDPATGQLLRKLAGHAGEVAAVAFSPDGKILATGSADQTVRLWDPTTGQVLRKLIGHEDTVRGVVFSPDGKLLASASFDDRARLWDPATGQFLRELTGHAGYVYTVAFSPDGKTLATGSADQTVRLWDPTTGQLLRQLTGHTSEVYTVAFSPDGKTLATGSADQTVRLWDPAIGQPLGQPLTGHTDWVNAVRFSPDGKFIASASGDKTVRLWSIDIQALLYQTCAFAKRNLSMAEWVELTGTEKNYRCICQNFPCD